MLRDRAQQGRPSLCSGTGRSRAVHPYAPGQGAAGRPSLAPGQDAAGRPSLYSGTGLRSQKKFLRSPVPTPMDGPNPQRQLHLRAVKGKNALVFRVHNTKTSIKAAFCAAKGIVSPNYHAQSTNTAQHPTICAAKGIIQPNYRAHNEERLLLSTATSGPRIAYIGPEQRTTPTLKPKNGLKWAGTMD